MASYGITPERTTPDTPDQKGAAERSGRAIVTTPRCMRVAARLPADM